MKNLLYYFFISLMGLAVIVGAPFITGGSEYHSFLPWIRRGVENFSFVSAVGLGLAGFVGGFVRPGKPWPRGFATMALLPVWASIEMGLDPTSHNLWPLEFGMYAFYSLAGVLGAFLGSWLSPNKKA